MRTGVGVWFGGLVGRRAPGVRVRGFSLSGPRVSLSAEVCFAKSRAALAAFEARNAERVAWGWPPAPVPPWLLAALESFEVGRKALLRLAGGRGNAKRRGRREVPFFAVRPSEVRNARRVYGGRRNFPNAGIKGRELRRAWKEVRQNDRELLRRAKLEFNRAAREDFSRRFSLLLDVG